MGTIEQKFNYTFNAKGNIKQKIINLGGNLTDDSELNDYADELQSIYDNYPKTEYSEGTLAVITGGKKGKLEIQEKGNTEQISTTGKNLWANTLEAGYTTTINGITFKVNEDKSILVKGTATANAQLYLSGSAYDQTITAGTYTFSGTPTGVAPGSSTFRMQLQEYTADSSGAQYLSANENGQKITLTSPTNTYRSYIIVYSGYTANNLIFKPQYELASAKTDYEPYTRRNSKSESFISSKY